MPMPSRSNPINKDLPNQQEQKPISELSQQEQAKKELEDITLLAVQEFKNVLKDPDSSPAERLKAATAIINFGHGKEGLKVQDEKQNHAQIIADALNASRYPLKTGLVDMAKQYIDLHPEDSHIIYSFLDFIGKQSHVG